MKLLIKQLFICFFFIELLFIVPVFAQAESCVELEPYVSALLDNTREIKKILKAAEDEEDIYDLLKKNNDLLTGWEQDGVRFDGTLDILKGGMRNGVRFDGIITLLRRFDVYLGGVRDQLASVLEGVEGYVQGEEYLGICDYLQRIYEFIVKPPVNPNFQPEVRYYGFGKVEGGSKEKTDEIARKLDHLVQYGQYKDELDEEVDLVKNFVRIAKDAARDRPLQYPTEEGHEKYYSAISAQSIFDKDQYDSEEDAQSKAAEAFIQNLVGNVTVPALRNFDPKEDKALEYVIYQKAMSAIQSVAARNVAELYAERLPMEYIKASEEEDIPGEVKSKLQLLKEMNTFYPSQSGYWLDEEGIGNLGLAQKALAFFDSFFALNFSLNRIYKQLEKAGLQLSLITIQNTFLGKVMYGNMLYGAATGTGGEYLPGVGAIGAAAGAAGGEIDLIQEAKRIAQEEGITEAEAMKELGMTKEEMREAGVTEEDIEEVFGVSED